MNLVKKIISKFDFLRPSKIYQRIDNKISRKLYGHGAGYLNHKLGESRIKNAIKRTGSPTPEAVEAREYGFSLIESYEPELMNKIKLKWESLIQDEQYVNKSKTGLYWQIKRPEVNIPIIKDLLNEKVLNHIRSYYQTEIEVYSVLCWRIFDPGQRRGQSIYSNWWHFDVTDTSTLKLFVTVSDVKEENGPFHVYPILKTKELVSEGYIERGNYGKAKMENNNDLFRFKGPPGTALICNTEFCVHKAGEPINNKTRDMIVFQFNPSNKPFNLNWDKNLQLKGNDRFK